MARPRAFDEQTVVSSAAEVFALRGYNATSIDDLVAATALLRGSLYKAFASKAGLFERSLLLQLSVDGNIVQPQTHDLLIVALKEVAPVEPRIQRLLAEALESRKDELAAILGARLVKQIEES